MLERQHLISSLYKYVISDELNYIYCEVCIFMHILYSNLYKIHTNILLYIQDDHQAIRYSTQFFPLVIN